MGKTRLAVELARALDARFVSLASVGGAEQVAPAIADALDIARVPGEPAEEALHRALARPRPASCSTTSSTSRTPRR